MSKSVIDYDNNNKPGGDKTMTITEKRAKLFKEWTLATMANDERYYLRTLALGIPDGTTSEEAFYDIEHGEYDEDIDDMIFVYEKSRWLFGAAGYIIDGHLSLPGDANYKRLLGTLPVRIYKVK